MKRVRRVRRRPARAAIAGLVCAVFGFASCSTSPQNFKSEGEKFLQSPELAQEAGYRFSDAVCEEPPTTSVGTTFTCAATDNDGDNWQFVIEITGERELTVVSGDLAK